MRIFPLRIAAAMFLTILLGTYSPVASGQVCPGGSNPESHSASVLHGTVLYHDELRHWIGLRLGHSACGQHEIQLVFDSSEGFRKASTLRKCVVTATGELFEGLTGYYSAGLAISDAKLKPDSSCHPFPEERDLSLQSIPSGIRQYYASIKIDYRGKGHIDVNVWRDEQRHVTAEPWQAYINYRLTGGEDVLWYSCRKGFAVKKISQAPRNPTGNLEADADLTGNARATLDPAHLNTIAFQCKMQSRLDSSN